MDEEASRRTIQQLLDMFIEPEIKKRQESGEIERPFSLQHAQIIFHPDGKPPEVRLNQEVKTQLKLALKKEFQGKLQKGDPIYWDQVEKVETASLPEDEDQNVGHATLLSIQGSWLLHFDFIYNKERSSRHLEAAQQFLVAAKNALEKKHWAVLIDSLCSASELTAKAYLLSSPDKTILESKTHSVVASKANLHKKLGNLQEHHIEAFNKVWKIRGKARYLEGDLNINEDEANGLLENLEEFIAFVQSRCVISSNN